MAEIKSTPFTQKEITRTVRKRLRIIVIRAVLLFLTISLLLSVIMVLAQLNLHIKKNPYVDSPLISTLESYYLAKGSWEGVSKVMELHQSSHDYYYKNHFDHVLIADLSGKWVYNPFSPDLPTEEHLNTARTTDLVLDGKTVARIYDIEGHRGVVWETFTQSFVTAAIIILGFSIIWLILAMVLMRRWVRPLSDIIGATQAVRFGDLSVRVPIEKGKNLWQFKRSINAMIENLEHNEITRQALFADVAHELRTPISVLKAHLDGILEGVQEPTPRLISTMNHTTDRLARLVEDIRLLSMAESRQLELHLTEFNMRDRCEKFLENFRYAAKEKRMTLAFKPDIGEPIVYLDQMRLEQLIGNLVSNAINYAPEGTVVELSLVTSNVDVEVHIKDQGPGIPEESLPYVFDRFWREDKSRSRANGGSGLGLSITKLLVTLQNGKIGIKNRPEGGLDVCVSFPLASTIEKEETTDIKML